jgi:hypothetical protein
LRAAPAGALAHRIAGAPEMIPAGIACFWRNQTAFGRMDIKNKIKSRPDNRYSANQWRLSLAAHIQFCYSNEAESDSMVI